MLRHILGLGTSQGAGAGAGASLSLPPTVVVDHADRPLCAALLGLGITLTDTQSAEGADGADGVCDVEGMHGAGQADWVDNPGGVECRGLRHRRLVVTRDTTGGMTADASAAYAGLWWYRLTHGTVKDAACMRALVPMHPEFPRKGAPYVNTLAVLQCPPAAQYIVQRMAAAVLALGANVVVAFETRAMAFAAVVAHATQCAFVPARAVSPDGLVGAHPVGTCVAGDGASYRHNSRVTVDGYAFSTLDRVVVVDDVVRTGATIRALRDLIESCEAEVVGCVAFVSLARPAALATMPRPFSALVEVDVDGVCA
jgi:adenine phosphoribosyltransferase